MLAAGAALGGGLALVGAMSASAQVAPPPEAAPAQSHIVRVVVDPSNGIEATAPPLPAGTQTVAAAPAAPVTESGGS